MGSGSVIQQFADNLSLEIEAATQSNPVRLKNISKSAPLNVKIRVKTKNETPQYGVIYVSKVYTCNEKIRLANSEQTVMSFDLFMEPDLQNRPKKHKRKLIDIIRRGTCLGTQDNDKDLCYLPSSQFEQTLKEQHVSSKSDYLLKQSITFSKRNYLDSSSNLPKYSIFLGKCKPGGCLDPPFNEDIYPYTPNIQDKLCVSTRKPTDTYSNEIKHNSSSIKKKSKINEASTLDKRIINDEKYTKILKLYEAETVNTSMSTTHSNSIITYPPTLTSSEDRIDNGKNTHNSITTEVKNNTINKLSDAYFIPSKRVIKQLKERKSEISNLLLEENNTLKFNLPINDLVDGVNVRNSTHLAQPTHFDTKLEGINNINGINESLKVKQECDKTTLLCERTNGPLEINGLQESVTLAFNEYLLPHDDYSQEHESMLSNDINMNISNSVHKSYNTNKYNVEDIYQSRQYFPGISEANNLQSSKYLKTDVTPKILMESDKDESMNIYEADTINSDKSLTKPMKSFDGNVKSVSKQLNNDTTKSDQISEQISDHNMENVNSKDIPCYNLPSYTSFVSKTDIFKKQNLSKIIKVSLELIKITDPNDQNYSNIKSEQINENKKSLLSEKVEDVMSSTVRLEDPEIDEKNYILSDSTKIDITNLIINNDNKISSKHSVSSENKDSVDTIHSILKSRYTSINKILIPEKIDFTSGKSSLNNVDSSKLHFVTDDQVVTNFSELSINKEKEAFLLNDARMDILERVKIENITNDLSIKKSPTQKSNIESCQDKSRTTNLNLSLMDSSILLDFINENTTHTQSLSSENSFIRQTVLHTHNDNNILLSALPGKNETSTINSLSNSYSQSLSLAGTFSSPNIHPHTITDNAYKSKTTIKDTPRLSGIDILSVHKPDVTKNTDITDLQTDTQLQYEYSDVNTPEQDSASLSHISLIQSTHVLNVIDKRNEMSVDLAFQIYSDKKNQRFLRSFSSENEPKRYSHDTVLTLNSEIRTSNCIIKIPIDTKKDLSIYIEKVKDHIQLPLSKINKGIQVTEQVKALNNTTPNKAIGELRNNYMFSICEKELIPLQLAIKSLKKEIDSLAEQHLIFKNNLYNIKKTKLIRFSNVGKRCGCFKDYF